MDIGRAFCISLLVQLPLGHSILYGFHKEPVANLPQTVTWFTFELHMQSLREVCLLQLEQILSVTYRILQGLICNFIQLTLDLDKGNQAKSTILSFKFASVCRFYGRKSVFSSVDSIIFPGHKHSYKVNTNKTCVIFSTEKDKTRNAQSHSLSQIQFGALQHFLQYTGSCQLLSIWFPLL